MAINSSNEPGPVTWVLDDEGLDNLLEAVRSSYSITLDLETTGLDEWRQSVWVMKGRIPTAEEVLEAIEQNRTEELEAIKEPFEEVVGARISLVSFTIPLKNLDHEWNGDDPTTYILPLSHPDSPWRNTWRGTLAGILELATQLKKPMDNQNIKYDARWVNATVDVDISNLITWDTKDGWNLLDETISAKLKERAPRDFGIPAWDDFDFSKPGASERVPLLDLGMYAARDTYWTWKSKVKQREDMFLEGDDVLVGPQDPEEVQLARLGRLAVWNSMPAVASLTKVEQRGMRLDIPWVRETLADDERIAREALQEMADRYGLPTQHASIAPTSHWFLEFTRHAVEANELRITETTDKGAPKWGRAILARQARQDSEVAALVLRGRKHDKRAQFLRSWLGYVSNDGMIHSSYNTGMSTGRLSSSGPNMQQVTKALRPAFIPRDGFVLADFDYCVAPVMRVLTSDLKWIEAGDLEIGQKLIGFPEAVGKGVGRVHQYEETEVTSIKRLTRPGKVIVLSDGREILCSAEHRWLSFTNGTSGMRTWVESQNLKPGDIISTLTEPWDETQTLQEAEDIAYLRGFLDGEGWVTQTGMGWGQLPGIVHDEVLKVSKRLGIEWVQSSHMNNGVIQHRVGNMARTLNILGRIRPHRLLPKARQAWEGRQTYGKFNTGVFVVEVFDAGEQEVIAIGTNTKTLIVEGLLSHNSQIEMRVAAFVSRSEPMIQAFKDGRDLHKILAATITGKDERDIDPIERQAGKSANFGLLYGMGSYGFQRYAEDVYGVLFSAEEAARVHAAYFETWEGIREWHQRAMAAAHHDGFIASPIGRIRRLPGIYSGNPNMVAYSERVAINSPVQGFASDLLMMSMSSMQGLLPSEANLPRIQGAFPVATVHDSIVVELEEDRWEEIAQQVADRMTGLGTVLKKLEVDFDVPLEADYSVGTRWSWHDVSDPDEPSIDAVAKQLAEDLELEIA